MTSPVSRRSFLKTSSLASASALAAPYILRGSEGGLSPNEKLNIACIGVGGQGRNAIHDLADQNFVAFCDVDDERAAETYEAHPNVPRFRDYRRMLDALGNKIDAVTVSTPDHMHYPMAVAALQLGKHVFVEKPLTHTVSEARHLARLAANSKVATQMGNQGHAGEPIRLLKEWFQSGLIGEVREVHCWTDRPGRRWAQGVEAPDHSKFIPVVPPNLDWDLWQGVAEPRPYDPAYLPFTWRGYWDFGTGAMGDMGCHILDGIYWAFELDGPTEIEAASANETPVSGPTSSVVTFRFPARGKLPPLKLTWYDGGIKPPLPLHVGEDVELPASGSLIVGSRETVVAESHYQRIRIVPEARMQAAAANLPPKTIPRVQGGHFAEWVRACKGGPIPGSNFGYAAALTEVCLLSNVAVRARRPLQWDHANMRVSNYEPANRYLTKEYRPGFGV